MRFSIGLAMFAVLPAAGAATAYDTVAAATRDEYRARSAHCRTLAPGARANCIKAARVQARSALGQTYADAMAGARATYANAASRCKVLGRAERRRCLRLARSERAMALGRAEEIRSAPLAMGPN
jgi:hypothetical protein